MTFVEYVSTCGFRLVDTSAEPDHLGRFHIARRDGSKATLLDGSYFRLDVMNANLGASGAQPPEALLDACGVRRMSTLMIGALLNAAVRGMASDTSYVNVGVWNGFSLFAGMAGNGAKEIAGIDNFSQFGGPRESFLEQFFKRRTPHHRFFDVDYLDFFASGVDRPIGVYFYDGNHSYENQLRGLEVAEPFLADECLIFVDDTNLQAPRQATLDFVEGSSRDYSLVVDSRTPYKKHPTLWNGLMVLSSGYPAPDQPIELAGSGSVAFDGVSPPLSAAQPPVTVIVIGDSSAERQPEPPSFDYPDVEVIVSDDAPTSVAEVVARSTGDLIALFDPARGNPPASALSHAVESELAKARTAV